MIDTTGSMGDEIAYVQTEIAAISETIEARCTDDSGVGLSHKEPSIPCHFVTKLDAAILRVVDIEMTGVYREPSEEEVIRTGGDPSGGQCTLESGDVVDVF